MRNAFRRAARPPAGVVARAGLPRGARVLAAAEAGDGSWLLGTATALVVVPPPDLEPADVEPSDVEAVGTPSRAAPTAILWQRVESADWDSEAERLQVTEVGEYGKVRPVHVFALADPHRLLTLVRERVTASVVLQRRVTVAGRRGFFVVARRAPTGTGDLEWAYEFDADVDPDDPEVRRLAESGLRAAAEELGL